MHGFFVNEVLAAIQLILAWVAKACAPRLFRRTYLLKSKGWTSGLVEQLVENVLDPQFSLLFIELHLNHLLIQPSE